jgi:hypothetical protein
VGEGSGTGLVVDGEYGRRVSVTRLRQFIHSLDDN